MFGSSCIRLKQNRSENYMYTTLFYAEVEKNPTVFGVWLGLKAVFGVEVQDNCAIEDHEAIINPDVEIVKAMLQGSHRELDHPHQPFQLKIEFFPRTLVCITKLFWFLQKNASFCKSVKRTLPAPKTTATCSNLSPQTWHHHYQCASL